MTYKLDPFQRIIHFHYTIVPDYTIRNEGQTVIFNVTTPGIPDGSVLYWNFIGVSGSLTNSDFTTPSSATSGGTVTIFNRQGTIPFVVKEDVLLEGPETFKLELRSDSSSGPLRATSIDVTIVDTSYPGSAPPPDASLVSAIRVNQKTGGAEVVPYSDLYINDIRWHPSGSCVAVAHLPVTTARWSVSIYNKIGSSLVLLTRLKPGYTNSVDWSPDGTKLLAAGARDWPQYDTSGPPAAIVYLKSNYSTVATSPVWQLSFQYCRFISNSTFTNSDTGDNIGNRAWSEEYYSIVGNQISERTDTPLLRPPMHNGGFTERSPSGTYVTSSIYNPWDGSPSSDYPNGAILRVNGSSAFVGGLPISGLFFNRASWNKQGNMLAITADSGGTSDGLGASYTGLMVYSVSSSNFTRLSNPPETGPDYFSNADLAASIYPWPLSSFHFTRSADVTWNPQGTKLALCGSFNNFNVPSGGTMNGIIIYGVSGGTLTLLSQYVFPFASDGFTPLYTQLQWDPSGSFIVVANNRYNSAGYDPQVLLYQVN